MNRTTVISIDAMGGDKGPAPILGGMVRALETEPGLNFIVHGDEDVVGPLLKKRAYAKLGDRCTVRHASETVAMTDKPSRALRERRDSSMWHALETVKNGEAPVAISAGNTGALLAMSVLVLRKAPGIDRPAIAVHWPSRAAHGYNTVLDMGADVRAEARNLAEYAVMGAEYARLSFGIERPRVGLLNVGTEQTKGPEALRDAAALISDLAGRPGVNFDAVGFVEGTDISGTAADVIVTDGFTGNVALKTAEGTASFIRSSLKEAFRHSTLSRLASLFALSSFKRFTKRIDPRRVNGGVFLGLNGAVVKSHGSADAVGFESAILLGAKMASTDFSAEVARQIAHLRKPPAPAENSGSAAEEPTK